MKIFKSSEDDNKFFEIVANELEQKKIDKALWLKALTKAKHKEDIAKTHYTKMRISQLKEEAKKEKNKSSNNIGYENIFKFRSGNSKEESIDDQAEEEEIELTPEEIEAEKADDMKYVMFILGFLILLFLIASLFSDIF